MTESSIVGALQQALAAHPDGNLCVGFSGGPDSSALLHALSSLPEAPARGLRAVHIDHGLNPDSQSWADHCQRFCETINVPLDIRRASVDTHAGTGIEAAARDARYGIFAAVLQPDEALLTAHHQDDQAETVLLKLLRGAGPEGLAGMRVRRPFANGWLWRPLLDTPHVTLIDYLREHDIDAIHDPSNASTQFARNFLRVGILPRLARHWPRASQTIAHSAHLNRQAADYIGQRSSEMLTMLQRPADGSLDAALWLALHPALRGPVLEQWLHARQLTAPSTAPREQLERQIREAANDRVPEVRWPGAAVHVWRGRLHAHPPWPDLHGPWRTDWDGTLLTLPASSGELQWITTDTLQAASLPTLDVRLGETGIRLRPAGDRHTRQLRDLFQQAGIPPWLRRRCPAIYAANGTLLAIADLWLTDAGKALFDTHACRPRWQPSGGHPLRHDPRLS